MSSPPTTSTAAWLDQLTVAELETDPYPVFARMRQEAPVAFVPAIQAYLATTWDTCTAIAEDAATFFGGTSPVHERVFGTPHVLGAEGAEHQQLRAAIDPALRPRAFRGQLEDSVRPVAKAEVERLRAAGRAELMADYFEPISVRAVGDLLGFADVEVATLRRWFHGMAGGIANIMMDPAGFAGTDAAVAEIHDVVEAMARRVTDEPDDGVVSQWLHSGMPAGQVRPLAGIYPSLHVLLLGGLQEPGHACGSTFLGLTTRPEQLQRVIADRSLLPRAVVEGLRWIAPIFSGTSRIPNRDTELAGTRIEAGRTVWVSYGSANRDETRFDDPDSYDIDRPAQSHLGFGRGRHVCSGAAFAPQVARIALEELFAAFPGIALDPAHDVDVWGWIFRGPRALHVTW